MQTLRLPQHPETLDLPALNKRLHAGAICLDWTHVTSSLSSVQLAILLSGLTLSEHSDLIGVATVPGSSFYAHTDLGRTKIRFCFPKTDDILMEAGRRLQKLAR